MEISKLNAGQICSVKSYTNSYCRYYVYKESKKFLFFTIRKEGFYYTMTLHGHEYTTVEEIEKSGQFVCRDKKVFYKPHLEIKMSNGEVYEKYFETEQELKDFMESDIMKEVKWINY